MPLYEYLCRKCRRRFSVLVGVVADAPPLECPRCGSPDAVRQVTRFTRLRSEEDLLDDFAESADLDGLDEDDPASVARFMKTMGDITGEDLGDDFEEAMEAEASGGEEGEDPGFAD